MINKPLSNTLPKPPDVKPSNSFNGFPTPSFTKPEWHDSPELSFNKKPEPAFSIPRFIKAEFAQIPAKKRNKRPNFNASPILSFDGEYIVKEGADKEVTLLSLQYCVINGEKMCSGIIFIDNGKRLRFSKFIKIALDDCIKQGVLTEYPESLIACAHFLRADLMHFSEAFSDFEGQLEAVRNTVVSMNETTKVEFSKSQKEKERKAILEVDKKLNAPIRVEPFNVYDLNRNYHKVAVKFYDSMLIAPTGQSLGAIGELLDMPKCEIPSPYSIDKMDVFLAGNKALFTEYAITDAVITAKYFDMYRGFCKEVGLPGLPFTVGGVALSLFTKTLGGDLPKLFGQHEITKEVFNKEKGKFRTIKNQVSVDDKIASEDFVTKTYHGGVNNCHQIGPTTIDTWYDYDAQSCYTTIANGVRTLDYAAAELSRDINDYLKDIMGFARVNFEFPPNTKYPCLPVRTDKYGLVYPLKGESWCTSHELVVAISLNAKVTIKQGFVIPWGGNTKYVFRGFMQLVRAKRKQYKAENNVFYEKLWKEIGNSLYGKTAQGMRKKTGFDIFLEGSKPLPPSKITNCYFASYITGFARALMFEQMVSIPDKYEIASVTTDGYLTNAPMSEINLNGPISTLFREFFHAMNGDTHEEILEEKHRVKQLILMKTRGQLSPIPIDDDPVLARAGVQVKFGNNHSSIGSVKLDQNAYMLDLYLNREPKQKHKRKSLVSSREQFTEQTDMVPTESEQRLNLEPDFKRNLINPKMRAVNGTEHIHLDTKPFDTIEDMLYARGRFDVWRTNNCLKSMADWDSWQEYYLMSIGLAKTNMRLKDGEHSGHLLLRLFLRAYGQKALGLCGDEYTRKELVAKFTEWGYSYKTSDFTPAKKATLYLRVVPATSRAEKLATQLTALFPAFHIDELFMD